MYVLVGKTCSWPWWPALPLAWVPWRAIASPSHLKWCQLLSSVSHRLLSVSGVATGFFVGSQNNFESVQARLPSAFSLLKSSGAPSTLRKVETLPPPTCCGVLDKGRGPGIGTQFRRLLQQ